MKNNENLPIDTLQKIEKKIDNLESYLLTQKSVLTFGDTVMYTGISRSYLYKLTSTRRIPHYKPNGKMIYFNREELDQWLQRNQAEKEEIECQASTYVTLNRGGGRS